MTGAWPSNRGLMLESSTWMLVIAGGLLTLVTWILPINERGYAPDCDIRTGFFFWPAAASLLIAVAITFRQKRAERTSVQRTAAIVAVVLLCGLGARVPEWVAETRRARICPDS